MIKLFKVVDALKVNIKAYAYKLDGIKKALKTQIANLIFVS